MKNVIIPLVLFIILKELLRYMVLKKAEGSKFLIILTCILFIFIDLINLYNLETFKTPYTIFLFLATYLLPYTSKNVLCTYISSKAGYKPVILYSMVMELYVYLLPIIPNPNQYMYALFQLLSPFVFLYRLVTIFKADKDEYVEREKNKKKIYLLLPFTIIMIVLAYLTSGYFRYHALVIGSGSMVPNIFKGDVVIVDKKKENIDNVKVGEIIAVRHNDIIVVHRLVKKIKAGNQYVYYTKGDANNDIDSYKITEDMIYGIVNKKIPYIGYPTIWLRKI
jgi:signal peptidase